MPESRATVPGVPDEEVPEAPSTRDGVIWDGEDFVPTQLAWHSGAWEPSDEPQAAVVNNETALEKLPPRDRLLVLLPVLALSLLLCAGGLALMDAMWASESGDVESSILSRIELASLIGVAVLLLAFVLIAVIRFATRRRDHG